MSQVRCYDTKHDWDQGTRAIRSERPVDWQQLPVGYYNQDPEITAIIRKIRRRLEHRIKQHLQVEVGK